MTARQRLYSAWWWIADELAEGARPDYWYALSLVSLAGAMVAISRLAA